MKKSKKKTASKKTTPKKESGLLYPDPKSKVCIGASALTVEQSKELLGWEEETEDVKFGNDYLLKDVVGNKIRCTNNNANRPLDSQLCKTWQSEILLGNWKLNGENLIIGQNGQCIDAQHRLIGLVLAAQEWVKDKERWGYWKKEPTLETFIAFGISEDDATVNTINTGKPRSLADVLFRSPYFADLPTSERSKVSRICAYAIQLLWVRVDADPEAFSTNRTHAKALDFLDRHPKILEAVLHIHNENGKESNIGKYLSVGHAAGFLYLMGCSDNSPDDYLESRREDVLNFDLWDTACDFWVEVSMGTDALRPLRIALGDIIDDDEGGTGEEKKALIVNAWIAYAQKKKVTAKQIELEYVTDTEGVKKLSGSYSVGGIDLGRSKEQADPQPDPSQKEIKERAEAEIKKRPSKKKASGTTSKKTTKKKTTKKKSTKKKKPVAKKKESFQIGDQIWVNDPDGVYDGELLQILGKKCRVQVAGGAIHEPLLSWVTVEEPA